MLNENARLGFNTIPEEATWDVAGARARLGFNTISEEATGDIARARTRLGI